MKSNTRPILIGTAEPLPSPSDLDPVVARMLATDGFYIGSNPEAPDMGDAPLAVLDGKVYSMIIDKELPPDRFIAGTRIDGPFRATYPEALGDAVARSCECENCGKITPENELNPVQDIWSRVQPGELMPAGECPLCGCLAHILPSSGPGAFTCKNMIAGKGKTPKLIKLLGDAARPESAQHTIEFPGGAIEVSRITADAYWCHIILNRGHADGDHSGMQAALGQVIASRIDGPEGVNPIPEHGKIAQIAVLIRALR